MKTKLTYSLLAAAAACGMAQGQTTAYTTPVGYITHTVAGAGAGAEAETYIASTLINASEFAGVSSVSPSGGAVITFSGGVPAGLTGAYVLEISSGANEGWWSTVVSSNSSSITVSDAFPVGLPASVSISVRKHATLATFLGFNNPGLVTSDGSNVSDEVQLFDPVAQSAIPFAFITAADWGDLQNYPNGVWFNLSTGEPENDRVIEPGTAVKIKRVGSAPVSFTSTGTVKTTKTQVDIYEGFNFVGATQAASGTLGNINFAPQLNLYDGSNADYDELQILDAEQVAVPFAAIDDGGPVMWNISAGDYATSEPFAQGTGLLLKRVGRPNSVITLNGATVTP